MFCPNCGTQLPDDAAFCPSCGNNIQSNTSQTQQPNNPQYQPQQNQYPTGSLLTQRGPATVLILSIITCGIYYLYWLYVTSDALQKETGIATVPPIAILLLALFVPIVGPLLFAIDAAKQINVIQQRKGLPPSDNTALYIVLGILINIVLVCIVQNEINKSLN